MPKGDKKRAEAAQAVRNRVMAQAFGVAHMWDDVGTSGQATLIAEAAKGDPYVAAYIGIRCYLLRLAISGGHEGHAALFLEALLDAAARNSVEVAGVPDVV